MGELFRTKSYRLTTSHHAASLDGLGAANNHRGRWNEFGQRVTYASSSRALAFLESRVHNIDGPPKDAVIVVIEIAVELREIRKLDPSELPNGWRDPYNVRPCQIRGSAWYGTEGSKVLVVPSVIVPQESNFVIRGGIDEAQVVAIESIDFDERLWASEQTRQDEEMRRLMPELFEPEG